MFCTNCGTKLFEGAAFCQNCGIKVVSESKIVTAKKDNKVTNSQKDSSQIQPSVNESQHKKINGQFSKVVGVLTSLAAIVFGRYLGLYLIIPLVGAFLAYLLFKKMLSKDKESFVLAASVQSGHFIWMMVGAFYIGAEGFSTVGLDAIIMLAGIVWLVAKPAKAPLIFLGIYQILSVIVNIVAISSLSPSDDNFKALIMHIILRGYALLAMYLAWQEIKKSKTA